MELHEYINEMANRLYKPLMDTLKEKHDLCYDKDNKLTTFGKTIVAGYNAMLKVKLEQEMRKRFK